MKLRNVIFFGVSFILLGFLVFINLTPRSWEQSPSTEYFLGLTAKSNLENLFKSNLDRVVKVAPLKLDTDTATFFQDLQTKFANIKENQSISYFAERYKDKNDQSIMLLLLRFEVHDNINNNILYRNQAIIQTNIQLFWLKDNSKINTTYDIAFLT